MYLPFVCVELTGVNTSEWSSLFNGQLDDVNSLDPMTGMQADTPLINSQPSCMKTSNAQPVAIDRLVVSMRLGSFFTVCVRWLVEETQKLERQQKLQQQKLMELQQVKHYSTNLSGIMSFIFFFRHY